MVVYRSRFNLAREVHTCLSLVSSLELHAKQLLFPKDPERLGVHVVTTRGRYISDCVKTRDQNISNPATLHRLLIAFRVPTLKRGFA